MVFVALFSLRMWVFCGTVPWQVNDQTALRVPRTLQELKIKIDAFPAMKSPNCRKHFKKVSDGNSLQARQITGGHSPHLSAVCIQDDVWNRCGLADEVVTYESKGEVGMTVFTPVIAVMYVVISCLALLLTFGFITETGKLSKINLSETLATIWIVLLYSVTVQQVLIQSSLTNNNRFHWIWRHSIRVIGN